MTLRDIAMRLYNEFSCRNEVTAREGIDTKLSLTLIVIILLVEMRYKPVRALRLTISDEKTAVELTVIVLYCKIKAS